MGDPSQQTAHHHASVLEIRRNRTKPSSFTSFKKKSNNDNSFNLQAYETVSTHLHSKILNPDSTEDPESSRLLNPFDLFSALKNKEDDEDKVPYKVRVALWLAETTYGRAFDMLQVVLSLAACGVYVASTYFPEQEEKLDGWVFISEVIFSLFFSVDWILHFYIAPHRVRYIYSLYSVIDLLTILPIFIALALSGSPFSVTFLRFIRVIRALRILRTYRTFVTTEQQVQRQAILLTFTAVSIIFCASGLIFALESEALGIQFHTAVYMIVVTISTVGYGDYSPVTGFGQLAIMIVILGSLIIVPAQTTALVRLTQMQSKYQKVYVRTKDEGHVILVGTPSTANYLAFVNEFFHEDHDNKFPLKLIIFSHQEPSEQMEAYIESDERVTWYKGTPLDISALERVSIDHAKAVFVVSDSIHVDPLENDKDAAVRALAIRTLNPSLPVFVKLHRCDFKATLISQGISDVLCVDEIRLKLLGKSAILPGFSTLVGNLTRTTTPPDDVPAKRWFTEFAFGTGHEIYSFPVPDVLIDVSFSSLVALLYIQFEVHCFAISCPFKQTPNFAKTNEFCPSRTSDDVSRWWTWWSWWLHHGETRQITSFPSQKSSLSKNCGQESVIMLNPSKYTFKGNETVFIIWQDASIIRSILRFLSSPSKVKKAAELIASRLNQYSLDAKFSLAHPRFSSFIRQNSRSASILSSGNFDYLDQNSLVVDDGTNDLQLTEINSDNVQATSNRSNAPTFEPEPIVPDVGFTMPGRSILDINTEMAASSGFLHATHSASPHPSVPIRNLVSQEHIGYWGSHKLPNVGSGRLFQFPKCFFTVPRPIPLHSAIISSIVPSFVKNHVIFICGPSTDYYNLVEPLRFNRRSRAIPIVILTSKADFSPEIWPSLSCFPNIYFVFGSSTSSIDLYRAGSDRAQTICILSQSSFGGQSSSYEIDVNSILTRSTVSRIIPESSTPMIITEVSNIDNLKFLAKYKPTGKSFSNTAADPFSPSMGIEMELFLEKDNPDVQSELLYPEFAGGTVFTTSLMDALISVKYYQPEIFNILSSFLSSCPLHESPSDFYQMPLPRQFIGSYYGDIVLWLTQFQITPIALYRHTSDSDESEWDSLSARKTSAFLESNPDYYIYTGPRYCDVLRETDLLYVLSKKDPQDLVLTTAPKAHSFSSLYPQDTTNSSSATTTTTTSTTSSTPESLISKDPTSSTSTPQLSEEIVAHSNPVDVPLNNLNPPNENVTHS